MSLIATLALAASASATLPQCSWDRPGANPFMGDVVAAVDRYADIPTATRDKLKARMKARRYDDIAVIERDAIRGQSRAAYAPEIRDMHFGAGSVCRSVTRARWAPATQERGLVYCEDGECILVPTVCRNVSRIRRLEAQPVAASPAQGGDVASATREAEPDGPLEFEAPGAGPAAAAAPGSFAQGAGLTSLGEGGGAPAGSAGLLAGGGPPPAFSSGGMPALPPGTVRTAESPGLPGVTPAVPEPGTWALIAAGLLVIGYRARRARR